MASYANFEVLEHVFDISQIPPGLLLDILAVNRIHLNHPAEVATQGS